MSDYENPLPDGPASEGNDDATIMSGMGAAGFEPPTPEVEEPSAAASPQPAAPPTQEPPAPYQPFTPAAPAAGSAAPIPPKKDNKKTLIIIVVIALLLLCCCCLVGVGLWFGGDAIMEAFEDLAALARGLVLA